MESTSKFLMKSFATFETFLAHFVANVSALTV